MPHRSYMVSPQGGGVIPPPPSGRRWQPGWGTVLNNSQIYGGSGGSYIGIPNANKVNTAGPVAPGTQMIVAVHAWNELEPNGKTDPPGTGPGQRFSGLIPIIQNELAQAATFANPSIIGPNNPVLYILRVIFKTQNNFGGINPLPADMTGLATAITGGWSAWRWNSTFQQRYDDLCAQINALFANSLGNNVYFGGIMTQETAPSFTPNGTTDGYTPTGYQNALIAEAASIVNGSAVTRPYFMLNDWPTTGITTPPSVVDQGNIILANICKSIHQYGAIIGFPDLATKGSVPGRYYALIKACHTGGVFTNAAGSVDFQGKKFGTYGCIQPAEWGGSPPGDSPVSIPNLFNYGTSSFAFKPGGAANTFNLVGGDGTGTSCEVFFNVPTPGTTPVPNIGDTIVVAGATPAGLNTGPSGATVISVAALSNPIIVGYSLPGFSGSWSSGGTIAYGTGASNPATDPNFGALDWSGNVAGQNSLVGQLDCLFPDWHTGNTAGANTGGYTGDPMVFNPIVAQYMIPLQTQFGNVTPNP